MNHSELAVFVGLLAYIGVGIVAAGNTKSESLALMLFLSTVSILLFIIATGIDITKKIEEKNKP